MSKKQPKKTKTTAYNPDDNPAQKAGMADMERWFSENDSAIPEPGDDSYEPAGPPADPAVLALMPHITALEQMIANNASKKKGSK